MGKKQEKKTQEEELEDIEEEDEEKKNKTNIVEEEEDKYENIVKETALETWAHNVGNSLIEEEENTKLLMEYIEMFADEILTFESFGKLSRECVTILVKSNFIAITEVKLYQLL